MLKGLRPRTIICFALIHDARIVQLKCFNCSAANTEVNTCCVCVCIFLWLVKVGEGNKFLSFRTLRDSITIPFH